MATTPMTAERFEALACPETLAAAHSEEWSTKYPPRTAERDAEIAAALAAYEGATTLTERIHGYCLCEQLMNSEAMMHRMDESNRIHREMVRIGKDNRVAKAALSSVRTYTLAEMRAMSAPKQSQHKAA